MKKAVAVAVMATGLSMGTAHADPWSQPCSSTTTQNGELTNITCALPDGGYTSQWCNSITLGGQTNTTCGQVMRYPGRW